ncbi:sigma-54-dependent transcriptional regulator [Candidatus Margulisiibacteriota bacterium]
MKKIFVMSPDNQLSSHISESLAKGYEVICFDSGEKLLASLQKEEPALLMMDCDFKKRKDQEAFKKIRGVSPFFKVVIISDTATIEDAVKTTRLGAANFLQKPIHNERLISVVEENTREQKRKFTPLPPGLKNSEWLLGTGTKMKQLFKDLEKEAEKESNILFISERGFDAEVLAGIVHKNSIGAAKRMDTVNLVSFQKEATENYFWTMIKGLLSDTDFSKPDSCGTLLLKNIDAVNAHFQESILKYMGKMSGSAAGHGVKVMISAGKIETVLDLEKKSLLGAFSKIHVPSLKERKEDIPFILNGYVKKYSRKYGKKISAVSTELLEFLASYNWPGNVMELELLMELAVLKASSETLDVASFPVDYKAVFAKLLANVGGSATLQASEDGLFKELVSLFRKKTGYKDEDLARVLDVPESVVAGVDLSGT